MRVRESEIALRNEAYSVQHGSPSTLPPPSGKRGSLREILEMENPKDSTKKLLELIKEFSIVAGYKTNIQKPAAFLYANYKITEREIKKAIPFTIASKRIKYLVINLTKDVKDLYSENSKTLKKMQIIGSIFCVHG